MIAHSTNPALHPMDTRPTPPPMAGTIVEVSSGCTRIVLSVGLDGQLYGSVDDAIAILASGHTTVEGEIRTAYLGFLRAIRKARETK